MYQWKTLLQPPILSKNSKETAIKKFQQLEQEKLPFQRKKSEDTMNGTSHELIFSSSNNHKSRKFDQLPLSLHPSLSLIELSEKDSSLFDRLEIVLKTI